MTSPAVDDLSGLVAYHQLHRNGATNPDFKEVHAFNHILTPEDVMADQATMQRKYMSLIFGGMQDIHEDPLAVQRAYSTIDQAIRTTDVFNQSVLNDVSKFIPTGQGDEADPSPDDMLDVFAQFRKRQDQTDDTDYALQALVSEPKPITFYYGKRLNRCHRILGQRGHLYDYKHNSDVKPYQNLSSETYAPREDGSQVPLNIQYYEDTDPRNVDAAMSQGSTAAPEAMDAYIDDGIYGQEEYGDIDEPPKQWDLKNYYGNNI